MKQVILVLLLLVLSACSVNVKECGQTRGVEYCIGDTVQISGIDVVIVEFVYSSEQIGSSDLTAVAEIGYYKDGQLVYANESLINYFVDNCNEPPFCD